MYETLKHHAVTKSNSYFSGCAIYIYAPIHFLGLQVELWKQWSWPRVPHSIANWASTNSSCGLNIQAIHRCLCPTAALCRWNEWWMDGATWVIKNNPLSFSTVSQAVTVTFFSPIPNKATSPGSLSAVVGYHSNSSCSLRGPEASPFSRKEKKIQPSSRLSFQQ